MFFRWCTYLLLYSRIFFFGDYNMKLSSRKELLKEADMTLQSLRKEVKNEGPNKVYTENEVSRCISLINSIIETNGLLDGPENEASWFRDNLDELLYALSEHGTDGVPTAKIKKLMAGYNKVSLAMRRLDKAILTLRSNLSI